MATSIEAAGLAIAPAPAPPDSPGALGLMARGG